MSNQLTTVEDFLQDEQFVRWVQTNDPQLQKFWEEWMGKHPEKKPEFLQARALVANLDFKQEEMPVEEKERLWQSLEVSMPNEASTPMQVHWRRRSWTAIAAAIALLLLGIGGWQWHLHAPQVITTSHGEQKSYTLSEGTKVILNANSSLTYVPNRPREVQLTGEAYFEVSKQPKTGAHFLVKTEDLTVRVLGTVFNVNCRNQATKVYLEEGQVKLEWGDQQQETVDMVPGDLVSYSSTNQEFLKEQQVNALASTSWKEGTLIFRDTPLVEVLRDLTEIYGVEFRVEEERLKTKLISGGLPIKNLEIALETLKGIYEIEIQLEGNLYIIGS
ncbi:MAG: FecR domain-containing protein [Bacteroidota bacterium]